MYSKIEDIGTIFTDTARIIYREKKKYTHIWRGIRVHVYVYMCIYVCVYIFFYICVYTHIFNIVEHGKAILRKIVMYFILDKRILSTSCQFLEA